MNASVAWQRPYQQQNRHDSNDEADRKFSSFAFIHPIATVFIMGKFMA